MAGADGARGARSRGRPGARDGCQGQGMSSFGEFPGRGPRAFCGNVQGRGHRAGPSPLSPMGSLASAGGSCRSSIRPKSPCRYVDRKSPRTKARSASWSQLPRVRAVLSSVSLSTVTSGFVPGFASASSAGGSRVARSIISTIFSLIFEHVLNPVWEYRSRVRGASSSQVALAGLMDSGAGAPTSNTEAIRKYLLPGLRTGKRYIDSTSGLRMRVNLAARSGPPDAASNRWVRRGAPQSRPAPARVGQAIAADPHRQIVATVLPLGADHPRGPPKGARVVEEEHLDRVLYEVNEVIVATDVRQFMRQ